MTVVAAVVAMAENRVIGKDQDLIWRLPNDLKHFRQKTMGHPMIMGRKTFETIGKPLPGRTTIIVTRSAAYRPEGCLVAHSVEEALRQARALDPEQVSIVGGGEIYRQALPFTNRIYLTLVHHTFEGDTFFPELNADQWQETAHEDHQPDEKHAYAYSFITLQRLKSKV